MTICFPYLGFTISAYSIIGWYKCEYIVSHVHGKSTRVYCAHVPTSSIISNFITQMGENTYALSSSNTTIEMTWPLMMIDSDIVSDDDLITLCKGKCSCTSNLISHISYSHLSFFFYTFISSMWSFFSQNPYLIRLEGCREERNDNFRTKLNLRFCCSSTRKESS